MTRNPNTNSRGEPFDEGTIEAVWKKATPDPKFVGFGKDVCGATIQHSKCRKTEQWGWEIDHIKPVAKGGGDELDNLQPLQWENNRHKGDNYPDWDGIVRD
jgi:5-methylcytosine-specific restriction endonuclease McrA